MKEVITIQMVEQKTVKYISDDGKEFDKELDCKKHEAEKRTNEVNTKFALLDKQTLDIPIADWYRCEGCTYKITFHNREDLNTFIDYYLIHYFMKDTIKEAAQMVKSYPYTTIVDEGYESIAFCDIEKFTRDIEKLMDQLHGLQ